jgi:hypothetical protein
MRLEGSLDRREEADAPPVCDERIFNALRADGKGRGAAMFPDERTGMPERLLVHDIKGDNACAAGYLTPQDDSGAAGFHGDEVNQANRQIRLGRKMAAHIRFPHRRNGMAAHRRMPVDAVAGVAHAGEQVAERLVAVDGRRGG